MLIARLKEEKKCKEEPNWKWTLVYSGRKSKSFKLHCCLSSLHMLIHLREKWPGGCGFLNLKLLRFMQFSFSLYLLSCHRLPHLTRPLSACRDGAEGWVRCSCPSASAQARQFYTCRTPPAVDERHSKARHMSSKTWVFVLFPLLPFSWVWAVPEEQRWKEMLRQTNQPWFAAGGVGLNLSLHARECHAARQQ